MMKRNFNGDLIGSHKAPKDLVKEMIQRRRQGLISNVVNVRYDDSLNDVIINSDPGRIRRPLMVVKRGNKLRTREEIQEMRQTRDPITSLREKMVSSKLAEADELKKIELDARKMV